MRASSVPGLTNCLGVAFALLLGCGAAVEAAAPLPKPHPLLTAAPAGPGKLNVLILGDSLALCGFGKRLDERFRSDPRVNATFTYMTCGTNPLSWLKEKPYSTVNTQCGFWAIESTTGEPRVFEDAYGMTAGHIPKAHLVPKLEDMIAAMHPDVLVVQTGGNLFGLFPDSKTVRRSSHAAALAKYFLPFKTRAIEPPSQVRKMYWVNPPVSGRVGSEVQEFVFEQAREKLGPEVMVIDSRKLVSYPYHHMEPDKEHFLGAQMEEWADKVYAIIEQDLSAQPLASLRPLSEMRGGSVDFAVAQPAETPARDEPAAPIQIARAEPVTTPEILRAEPVAPPPIARAEPVAPAEIPPPAEAPQEESLLVRARLVFKSQPMPLQELLPYRESLVAYVYEIDKVVKGRYDERQILVMHPAHIGAKEQRLKYRIGKRYKMRLDPMEGTLWETAKARDESGQINLQPYIQVEDKKRHPENRTR